MSTDSVLEFLSCIIFTN